MGLPLAQSWVAVLLEMVVGLAEFPVRVPPMDRVAEAGLADTLETEVMVVTQTAFCRPMVLVVEAAAVTRGGLVAEFFCMELG